MARRKGRILAFQALFAWEASKLPLEDLLNFTWIESEKLNKLGEEALVFPQLLIAGSLENIAIIDSTIKKYLNNWDFDRLNKVDLAILRISIYSLLFQKDIHPSIVIDEAVDIAKEFGSDDSYKFINGILDNIRKNLGEKTI